MAGSMLLSRSLRVFSQIIRPNFFKMVQKQNNQKLVVFHYNAQYFLAISRGYAKNKDRKKEGKHKSVAVNESMLSQLISLDDFRGQLNRVTDKMKEDFIKNFTLRTSLTALDALEVDFEGTVYNLQDVAQIGKKSSNLYVVDLSSFPQVIPNVLKAIQISGLGLNPQQDGTRLYIPVPKITKEHRETLSKNAKAVFIRTRDDLRNVQNKFIKGIKSKENVSEDLVFSVKEQIIKITDQCIAEAEEILKAKQKELIGN